MHEHKSTFCLIFSLGALYAFKALMLNVYVVFGPVPKIPFAVFPICAREMRLSYHTNNENEDYTFFTSIKRRSCWTSSIHHLFIPSYSFHHIFFFIRFYIDSSQVDLGTGPHLQYPYLSLFIYIGQEDARNRFKSASESKLKQNKHRNRASNPRAFRRVEFPF